MEGIHHSASRREPDHSIKPLLLGLTTTSAIALAAYAIHHLPFAPFEVKTVQGLRHPLSAAIIAIFLGMLLRNLAPLPAELALGCRRIVRLLVPTTIVLAGAGLDLALLAAIGGKALAVTGICMAVAGLSAYYYGRLLGLWKRSALLIGAGTAICGTSAIMAVGPLIDARDEDVALSVSTVNLLGLCLMFSLPLLGGALGLSSQAFGIWAGSTIHAVPQAVAAGFAHGEEAGAVATLVKLVRVAMLAPVLLMVVWLYARGSERRGKRVNGGAPGRAPNFLWGFLILAVMGTAGLLPALQFNFPAWLPASAVTYTLPLKQALAEVGNLLLTLAMGAMGMEVGIHQIVSGGRRAILTGIASSVTLCAVSLVLINLLI